MVNACSADVATVSGILPVVEALASSPTGSNRKFELCDSGAGHSWNSQALSEKLSLTGPKRVIGLNRFPGSSQIVTKLVSFSISPIGDTSNAFEIDALTKDQINIRNEVLHLELPNSKFSYADIELVWGQTALYCTRPLEYGTVLNRSSLMTPLGWTVGGRLPQRQYNQASAHLSNSNSELAELAASCSSLESY